MGSGVNTAPSYRQIDDMRASATLVDADEVLPATDVFGLPGRRFGEDSEDGEPLARTVAEGSG